MANEFSKRNEHTCGLFVSSTLYTVMPCFTTHYYILNTVISCFKTPYSTLNTVIPYIPTPLTFDDTYLEC